MNIKKYVDELSKKPVWDLVLTIALLQSNEGNFTSQNILEIIKEVDRVYFDKGLSNIDNYLLEIDTQATADKIKAAKKSKKSYMEYLIYMDEKKGVLTSNEAKQVKENLPLFLNNKNAIQNDK